MLKFSFSAGASRSCRRRARPASQPTWQCRRCDRTAATGTRAPSPPSASTTAATASASAPTWPRTASSPTPQRPTRATAPSAAPRPSPPTPTRRPASTRAWAPTQPLVSHSFIYTWKLGVAWQCVHYICFQFKKIQTTFNLNKKYIVLSVDLLITFLGR